MLKGEIPCLLPLNFNFPCSKDELCREQINFGRFSVLTLIYRSTNLVFRLMNITYEMKLILLFMKL